MTACFAPERLPRPFDPAAATLARDGFAERGAAERDFAASAAGRALLDALGGHSPYLAELAIRESKALMLLAERGPDDAMARALDPLARIDPQAPRAAETGSALSQLFRMQPVGMLRRLLGLRPVFEHQPLYVFHALQHGFLVRVGAGQFDAIAA